MKKIFVVLLSLVSFLPLFSSASEDIISEIERLMVYTEYGDGDIAFTTKTKGEICYGYWVSASWSGYDKTSAFLISAFLSDTKVELAVSPAESTRWPASTNFYCKVVRVGFVAE